MKIKTYLTVQFSNGSENNIVIAIQKFSSLISDLTVFSDTTPDSFDIEWNACCQPYLTFVWSAVVRDDFLTKTHQVNQKAKLTLMEATQLKKILIQNFSINLLFKNEGKTSRIKLETYPIPTVEKGYSLNRRSMSNLTRSKSTISVGQGHSPISRDAASNHRLQSSEYLEMCTLQDKPKDIPI